MTRVFGILAAFSGVLALYGHRLGISPEAVAPLANGLALGSLAVLAAIKAVAADSKVVDGAVDADRSSRGVAWTLLWAGIVWAWLGVGLSMLRTDLTVQDYGVIALVLATPLLIAFVDRRQLFMAILRICVVFALIDAAANFLAVLHLIDLEFTARVDEFGLRTRYPGLSGNTHAAGLVCFVAIFYLTILIRRDGWVRSGKWIAMGLVILVSLIGIDARRYLAMAMLCIIFVIPAARRVPLFAYAAALVVALITATFTAPAWDAGNYLRSELMLNGWYRSLENPFIGEGLFYRSSAELIPTFDSLSSAGVTETVILEYAIAFGMLGSLLFFLSPIITVAKSRNYAPMAIVLAMLTAEMFFGGSLRGVLGSILFYCCLIGCLSGDDGMDLVGERNMYEAADRPGAPLLMT